MYYLVTLMMPRVMKESYVNLLINRLTEYTQGSPQYNAMGRTLSHATNFLSCINAYLYVPTYIPKYIFLHVRHMYI